MTGSGIVHPLPHTTWVQEVEVKAAALGAVCGEVEVTISAAVGGELSSNLLVRGKISDEVIVMDKF